MAILVNYVLKTIHSLIELLILPQHSTVPWNKQGITGGRRKELHWKKLGWKDKGDLQQAN
jgi:hypothetical protein